MKFLRLYLALSSIFIIINCCDGAQFCIGNQVVSGPEMHACSIRQLSMDVEPDSLFAFYFTYYQDSILVYERLLNDEAGSTNELLWQFRKGVCYKKRRSFLEASKAFKEIDKQEVGDSASYQIIYQTALCDYLGSDFESAAIQCLSISELIKDSTYYYRSIPLQALIYNELAQWNKAYMLMQSYIAHNAATLNRNSIKAVDSIYARKSQPHLKSAANAKWLNTFIPGMGYLYSGNIKEGLINTGLMAVFAGIVIVGIVNGYYLSPVLGIIPLTATFYKGGRTRSAFLVEQKNYKKKKEYNLKLRKRIIELG